MSEFVAPRGWPVHTGTVVWAGDDEVRVVFDEPGRARIEVLVCDGCSLDEPDWRSFDQVGASRLAQKLCDAVLILQAVRAGKYRAPSATTRPRTATGAPPVTLGNVAGAMKFLADELKAAFGQPARLYRFADDVLARHEREMDELGG